MKTKDEQILELKNRVNRLVQEKGIDGNTIVSWQKECKKATIERDLLRKGVRKVLMIYARCYKCSYSKQCSPNGVIGDIACIELHTQ